MSEINLLVLKKGITTEVDCENNEKDIKKLFDDGVFDDEEFKEAKSVLLKSYKNQN